MSNKSALELIEESIKNYKDATGEEPKTMDFNLTVQVLAAMINPLIVAMTDMVNRQAVELKAIEQIYTILNAAMNSATEQQQKESMSSIQH